MKIRFDEHISPFIVRAVRDLALSSDWEVSTVLEAGHGGDADEYWITKFAKDGGNVIISADRDFFSLEPQVNAVFDTGIKVIHLPKFWGQAKGCLQAAHILMWWNRIERTIVDMKPRQCYRPDWNIRETGELKVVKFDFAKSQKQRKKKARKKKA